MENNEKKEHWFITLVKNHTITLVILAFSACFNLISAFTVIKLAPILQSIRLLEVRADTYESKQNRQEDVNERFYRMESTVEGMDKKIDRMETKVDLIIERQ